MHVLPASHSCQSSGGLVAVILPFTHAGGTPLVVPRARTYARMHACMHALLCITCPQATAAIILSLLCNSSTC